MQLVPTRGLSLRVGLLLVELLGRPMVIGVMASLSIVVSDLLRSGMVKYMDWRINMDLEKEMQNLIIESDPKMKINLTNGNMNIEKSLYPSYMEH